MKNIIFGYGNIGRFLHKELSGIDFDIYDPYILEYSNLQDTHYNVAFICVPTEMKPDGSADISCVEDAVNNANANVICIKSAVPMGTCELLARKYDKRIVISPEYVGMTQFAPEHEDFLILGGDRTDCFKVTQVYWQVKKSDFKVRYTDYKTAELAKYMENCFLALKVTFCCEFADIAEKFGVDYAELRECFVLDKRMGDSHTFVYKDKPYYDSHCLNKDIPALISFAGEAAPLMTAMNNINKLKKANYVNNAVRSF